MTKFSKTIVIVLLITHAHTTLPRQDYFKLSYRDTLCYIYITKTLQQDNPGLSCPIVFFTFITAYTRFIYTHTIDLRFSSFRVKNLLVSVYSSYTLAGLVQITGIKSDLCRILVGFSSFSTWPSCSDLLLIRLLYSCDFVWSDLGLGFWTELRLSLVFVWFRVLDP